MTIQNIHFQAQWNPTNRHLQTPVSTTARKASYAVGIFFSVIVPVIGLVRWMGYCVGRLANRLTLPAAHYIKPECLAKAKVNYRVFWEGPITDKNKLERSVFTAEDHTIVTPDGAALNAKLVRHKNSNGSTPTVIYFNGNFALSMDDPNPWLLQKSIENETPCNFVFFDYRGVGDSKGTFNAAKV